MRCQSQMIKQLLMMQHDSYIYFMGFEQAVPPVPDRLQEVQMLDKIEDSWLKQPYYRYYMQEDIRRNKMEYASYNLNTRRKFLLNCLLVSLFTLPLAYYTRKYYTFNSWRSSGIPFTKELTYFEQQRTPEFVRTKAANKAYVWVWFVSTCVFSTVLTDWNYRSDENYNIYSKVPKML